MSKVCWVTGASSGIGEAVADSLSALGHTVILSSRGETALHDVQRALLDKGRKVDSIPVDVTNPEQLREVVRFIVERHGRLDVLVANAGTNVGVRAWGEVVLADFDRLVQVNLGGVYYCIDAVLPIMRKQGGGQIVNVASWAGKFFSAKPGPGYTAAKAAVVALTTSLNASEYAHGIRACAISPGEVATPAMARRQPPVPAHVLERMLQVEDVAAAVSFAVALPPRACANEIVISPTWNAAYGAPAA